MLTLKPPNKCCTCWGPASTAARKRSKKFETSVNLCSVLVIRLTLGLPRVKEKLNLEAPFSYFLEK